MKHEREQAPGQPTEAAPANAASQDRATVQEVQRKAARMARARRGSPSIWRYFAQVGVLGWLFILPVVALAAVGRWLGRFLGHPSLALIGVLLGLAVGGFAAWQSAQRSLREEEDADDSETDR